MTYTINLSQLNAAFGIAMPFIVSFIAGFIRQDGFKPWVNETISHLVIVLLAITQTLLGGQWGGSGIANFAIIVSLTYGALSTRFGNLQTNIQTSTSLLKSPPAPPALTLEAIAGIIAQQFQAYLRQQPIDAQPTQQMPTVTRTNTQPPPSFQQGG